MTSKLTQLAQQRSKAGIQQATRESYKWLLTKIAELRGVTGIASKISKEQSRERNRFVPGGLYYFYYDPKTKAEMPYYDKFPLVLILDVGPDSFMGLNLHYLPLNYRLALLDKLMDFATLDKNNDIRRMRVTYDILSASKTYKEFKPCLKKYLFSHVQSKILAVNPNEWDIAVHLPIQQFKKASPEEVWQDSLNEIRK